VIWTRAIISGACTLVVVAAPPARAQPAGAQAEVLYNQGRDLVAAGKIAEGCAAFEQSQKLDPAVTTLTALAVCREKQGLLATAWGLFLEVERQTRSARDKATEQLNKLATEHATKLEPRVSKLTISIPDRSKIGGLEILRDKESVPPVMWNRALPVDGGTYTIRARAPGANDWSTTVTLAAAADTKTVDIPDLRNLKRDLVPRTDVPPGKEQTAGPPEAPAAAGHGGGSALPIVVGAGAVALLGGALGLSLWGDATYDDAKAEMMDQARRDSLYDSANRKRYAAEGLAVAGVGCAGVAVWLYLRQRGERSEVTAARLMLAPTTSGIGIAGQF